MRYSAALCRLTGATGLIFALSSGPTVMGLLSARVSSVSLPRATSGVVHLQGTLIALHRVACTGDIALANGELLPLRFTSVAQERLLHVGDSVAVAAEVHGRARLLVRTIRTHRFGGHWLGGHWFGGHWFGGHWFGGHWLIQGTTARLLSHGNVEVLGVHGAAVVVHIGTARLHVAQTTSLFAPTAAYAADSAAQLRTNQDIVTEVTLTRAGTLDAVTVTVVASHVGRVDVEGRITAVNHAAGTVTITDENGQSTVVAMGSATAGYHVGQDAVMSGTPTGPGSSDVTVQAHDAQTEPTTVPGQADPTPGVPTPVVDPGSQAAPDPTVESWLIKGNGAPVARPGTPTATSTAAYSTLVPVPGIPDATATRIALPTSGASGVATPVPTVHVSSGGTVAVTPAPVTSVVPITATTTALTPSVPPPAQTPITGFAPAPPTALATGTPGAK